MIFFFRKTLVFSICFLFVTTFITTYGKMFFQNSEYPMWKSKIEYISSSYKNENLIIGDSRACAGFVPDFMEGQYYNLAVGGGTPIEGYYFLKKIINDSLPKKLILSYAPFHLGRADTFKRRTTSFCALTKSEIYEVMNISEKFNEDFTVYDKNKYNSYFSFSKKVVTNLLKGNLIFFQRAEFRSLFKNLTRPINNFKTLKNTYKNSGYHAFGTKNGSSNFNFESSCEIFKNSKVLDHYLKLILQLAKNNNIEVYYFNLPFNEASYKKTNKNFIIQYNDYFMNLKRLYPDVNWFENIYFYDDSFFGDSSHLNFKGASKFSNEIYSIVNL